MNTARKTVPDSDANGHPHKIIAPSAVAWVKQSDAPARKKESQEEGVSEAPDEEREKEAKSKDGSGVKPKKGEPLLDKRSREDDKAQKGA
jgi:hypothetical protein